MAFYDKLKGWLTRRPTNEPEMHEALQKLRERSPVPLFWLFGKTQSGKTTVVKFLTGANDAEVGRGFRPCTRFSRRYEFPTAEAPILGFLDTRGVDEPGYDVHEDLANFNQLAHVVIVTVKAMDHAQENVLKMLKTVREAHPSRPVVLALTCLHEGYPQQQHPPAYPYQRAGAEGGEGLPVGPWKVDSLAVPEELRRSLAEQARRFEGLFDLAVPVDLTRPEEGFTEPNFGGDALKQALLEVLPSAYRQTLLTLDEAEKSLQELFMRRALPHIVGYSTLAATAGAIPIPWVDLLILPGIQTRMIYSLAQLYGQPMDGKRFMEMASSMGSGVMMRQATRELVKFIPYVGSVAGGALAGTSTFALGKAFCYYYQRVHQGHVPKPEDLKRYYQEQLGEAEKAWFAARKSAQQEPSPAPNAPPAPEAAPPDTK